MDEAAERPWPAPERLEQLLDDAVAHPAGEGAMAALAAAGETRLAGVVGSLTAGAGGRPLDPVREEAALAAFRMARLERAVRARAPRVRHGGLAAAIAVGGLVLLAGTGVLLDPFHGGTAGPAGPSPVAAEPSGASMTGGLVPDGEASTRTPTRTEGLLTAAPTTPPPTPTAQKAHPAVSMCLRYTEAVRQGGQPDADLTEQLRRAAGGNDRIGAYCRRYAPGTGHGRGAPHPGAKRP